MDIKVRNIDPTAVKKIDELAKKKGTSRNEFVRIQLKKLASENILKDEYMKMTEIFTEFRDELRVNNERLRLAEKKLAQIQVHIKNEEVF